MKWLTNNVALYTLVAYMAGMATLVACGHNSLTRPEPPKGVTCDTTWAAPDGIKTRLIHCVESCDPETVIVEVPGPSDTTVVTVTDTLTVTVTDTVTVFIPIPVECPDENWQCILDCMEINGLGHWRECLRTCL